MQTEDSLKQLPFWDALDRIEKNMIQQNTSERFYRKDTNIQCFSDACFGMIYVLEGAIRVSLASAQGRDITLFHIDDEESCILSASCIVGELAFDVFLTAEKDTKLLALHADCFQQLIEKNLYVRCFAFELSTKRLAATIRVMQQILFSHFDERMARLLLSIYDKAGNKTIKMTQEALAKEVNSAREVVARMLKVFVKAGWIEINRGEIVIKDVEALRKIAKGQ